jgi:hypothetical protein
MVFVLFINHSDEACGVYQYGKRLFNIIQKDKDIHYIYKEITNLHDYYNTIEQTPNLSLVIYNYHISTMKWLAPDTIQKKVINIGILHESFSNMFDKLCYLDPMRQVSINEYKIPRPIFEDVNVNIEQLQHSTSDIRNFITSYTDTTTPIFGSFGFGFRDKGFNKIITMVNEQYDHAVIKIVITQAKYANYSTEAIDIINECMSIPVKSGIRVMITNEFFSEQEILMFLHFNTMNLFLYDKMHGGRGISTAIDYAISTKKPIGISDSYKFRHIYSDAICVNKNPLAQCMIQSDAVINRFLLENSHTTMINTFNSIVTDHIITLSNVQYYRASGRLGDLIYQLSVIYENFLNTGKKGVLYLSSEPEPFSHGLEKAYHDTKNYILSLPYIHDYTIHNNESYEIDLSKWRYNGLLETTHWNPIFKHSYNVDWGTHQWLFSKKDPQFEGKILFSCSIDRFPYDINFHDVFKDMKLENIIFITQNHNEYTHFNNNTGINLTVYHPDTIDSFICAVNSCSLFIGNLSSPLTYAYGLHKPSITLLTARCRKDNGRIIGTEKIIPTTIILP